MDNPLTQWISFDVETMRNVEPGINYGLQPWRAVTNEAIVRCWAISWIEDGKLCHEAHIGLNRHQMSLFLQKIAREKKTLIVWKGTFDIAFLIAYGLIAEVRACNWLDALIVWKNVDRHRRKYGLKLAVELFFPQHAGYERDIDFEGNITPLLKYNMLDTDLTLLLALKFWGMLTEREKISLLIDMCDLTAVAESNVNGIFLNVAGVKKTVVMLHKKRSDNLAKLMPYLETISQLYARGGKIPNVELKKRFPDIDLKSVNYLQEISDYPAINLDSDQQVAKLLFQDWNLPVYKLTPKGAVSVDKEVLLETAHLDERAKWLQQYRETTGLISKCVKAVVKTIQYNNEKGEAEPITRPELNKAGTVTDRCTYSSYQDSK